MTMIDKIVFFSIFSSYFLQVSDASSAQQSCQSITIQRCTNGTGALPCIERICINTGSNSSSPRGVPALISITGFPGNDNGLVTKIVNASTRIEGCAPYSSTTVFRDGIGVRAAWTCKTAGGDSAEIMEQWSAGPHGSLEWNTSIRSPSTSLWSAAISHQYAIGLNSSAQHRGWVPAASEHAYPSSGFSPLQAWSLDNGPPGTVLPLGSEGGSAVGIMGMFAVLFDDDDTAVSVMHDPEAQPYSAALEICNDKAFEANTSNNSSWFQAGSYDALWGVCDTCVHKPNASVVSNGTTESWQACQAACNTYPDCSIYAWSAKTGGCSFRLDGVWGGEGTRTRSCGPLRMSGCRLASVAGCGTNPGGSGPNPPLPHPIGPSPVHSKCVRALPHALSGSVDAVLTAAWTQSGFRLGGVTAPVQLRQIVAMTPADWRPAFGLAVTAFKSFFDPHVNVSHVDGPGTYSHLGQGVGAESSNQTAWLTGYNYTYGLPGNPPLPPQYADLGVTLNWDATFPYQSHGVFVPYNLSSGAPFGPGGWTTCFGSYDCPEGQKFISPACAAPPCWQTSYAEINRVYESLRANYGISNCMYGNFWEFGFNVSDPRAPLYCAGTNLSQIDRGYCDTNLPLRSTFKGAWMPNWDGRSDPSKVDRNAVIHNGMDYSIVMDAANPNYRAHLLKMTDIMLAHVPASAGICIDGTASWTKMSPFGDDNRTLCGGKYRCHTQIGTFISTAAAIGKKLHDAGKTFFWNPSQPRVDMLRHFDGIFSELGYAMPQIALQSLLTVNKPNVMWNAGCYIRGSYVWPPVSYGRPWQCARKGWAQPLDVPSLIHSLHGSLHLGIYFSPPFPGQDHAAYPQPDDHRDVYARYLPLFRTLRGKRWFLAAHALAPVRPPSSGVIANIFEAEVGMVVVLGFGVPRAQVVVDVSGFPVACPSVVMHATANVSEGRVPPIEITETQGRTQFTVALGEDGEAVLVVPQNCV